LRIDLHKSVRDYHLKFGQGIEGPTAAPPSDEVAAFRCDLFKRAGSEFIEASEAGDLVRIAKSAVTVLIVVLGTIIVYGLPFNNLWNAVMTANMKRSRAVGNTKAMEPAIPQSGWRSPDKQIKLAIYRDETEKDDDAQEGEVVDLVPSPEPVLSELLGGTPPTPPTPPVAATTPPATEPAAPETPATGPVAPATPLPAAPAPLDPADPSRSPEALAALEQVLADAPAPAPVSVTEPPKVEEKKSGGRKNR
jgi:hypothetical protein